MKKQIIAVMASAMVILGGGAIASADSQTVKGEGDIVKIIGDNAKTAVTTRVFGFGEPCGGAKQFMVYVENRTGKILYFADAACVAGTDWNADLLYTATGDIQDQELVHCRKFDVTRNADTGAYRVFMPRTCLDKAPDRIRIEADGVNYGSASGGHAGPTKVLARG